MSQPLPSSVCPKCHAPIPIGAPQGLCPKCLLAAVSLPTDDGGASQHRPAPPPLEAVAAAFPQLEILELIGQGGMGVVFKARQKSLGRLVALKLLAPGREQNPAFADRFAREARALAGLSHPNTVTIHDFGFASSPLSPLNPHPSTSPSGFFFLLMEFVDGVNLRQAMRAGRFTPEQALAIVPPVCEALQYAHEHGIVHRDIKPENLLLDKTGRIKIADFGIAKLLAPGGAELPLGQLEEAAQQRSPTAPDSLLAGTPQYMAPEQRGTDQRVDSRADIYSLGVVLYELLTGELPAEKLQPPSRKVQIDVRLDEIVMRALEQKPELRFATATDFRTQVEAFSSPSPSGPGSRTPPPSMAPDQSPRLLKTSTSTLTTPETLARFAGQFFHYRNNRGQLLLDEQRLVYSRHGSNLVIPLASIRDVSLGQYPRTMNPVGINLLSVTYDDNGKATQILLSPMDGFWALPAHWNDNVRDWFHALRAAILAATGREPTNTPANQLGIPAGATGIYLLYSVPVVMALFMFFTIVFAQPGSASLYPAALIPLIFAFGFFAAVFVIPKLLARNHRVGIGTHSPPPPASRSQKVWTTILFLAALLCTANFSAPHLSVLGDGSTYTWTLGLTTPWLAEIHQSFPNSLEVRAYFDRSSFLCGFIAMAAWVVLGLRLRTAHGPVLLRVRTEPDHIGHSRILWGNASLAWLSVIAITSVASCFLIAAIASFGRGAPPIMPTLMFNIVPATLVVGMALFAQQKRGKDGQHMESRTASNKAKNILAMWVVPFIALIALMGSVAGFFLLNRQQFAQLSPPVPVEIQSRSSPDDWTAARIDTSASPRTGEAVIRIVRASTSGSILLLTLNSESGFPRHFLQAQFYGSPSPTSIVLPPSLQTDCLLEPRRATGDGTPFGGHLVSGTNLLAGPGTLRLGFIFPNEQLAQLAARQVQGNLLERPFGLTRPQVTLLFSLGRSLGQNPNGGNSSELLTGSLSLAEVAVAAAPIQAPPEMTSDELSRFFAIPAKLAELPHLRFVAWQDQWKSNEMHSARHADGSEVTSDFELRLMRAAVPTRCDVSQTTAADRNPRFLHLWFAHPLFDRQSLNQVTIANRDGKPIVPVSSAMAARAMDATPTTGNLGWLTHTLSPGEWNNAPKSINLQLRYTIGPVDHEVRLQPKSNTWGILDGDAQLNGIGQDVDGHTFVAIAQAGQLAAIRQFIIVAVTRDGRNVESSTGTGSAGPADGKGVRVCRFSFDVPLASVAYFRAGTRPVRELNLVDVRLPPD